MTLRFAAPEDVSALLSIYERYISTPITFEYTLPSLEEFARRVASVQTFYPYLVAEENGELLGYAYAHRIAERAAYRWGAELSIYLRPDAVRRGLGKQLYQSLIALLRLQGVRTVYGLVASPNPASEGLHRSLGFHRMGVQRNAGYKNGRWVDLIWFEQSIAPYVHQPGPVLPVGQLAPKDIETALL
ncbi:MAG: N-acetyltransferase [Lawsonibacter sp.]|jgi:phosphinothricin acetyltransferase|nr:N-acetyltransferase [Lawsonibacter sp.]